MWVIDVLEWLRDLVGPAGGLDGLADDEPPVVSDRAEAYADRSSAERGDVIVGMAGMMAAAQAELLDAVVAADAARDFSEDGSTDMEAWLVAMCNVSRPTAREWVRVAHAVQTLPELREQFASGRLSWDQLRFASWFVTPETDAAASAELPGLSAAQLARLARRHRPHTDDDAKKAQRHRRLQITQDRARGGYRYSGFLPTLEGAAVNATLLAAAETAGPNPETGRWDPLHIRLADALVDHLTGSARSGTTDAGVVVIHADAAEVDGEAEGTASIGDMALNTGGVMAALCDAECEVHLHGPDGATVGIGRSARRPPPWLRRHIYRRDQTCRFRGCERPIRQIHHIQLWTCGGVTDADNLVGLCWAHHHLVHEGKWTIEGSPEGELVFVSPGGRRIASRPQPVSAEVRHLVDEALGHDSTGPPTRRSGR